MKKGLLFICAVLGFGFGFAQPGSPDLNFDGDGRAWIDMGSTNEAATDQMLLPDGKILLSGEVVGSNIKFGVTRLNPDGSVDHTFGFDGKVITDVGSPTAYCYDAGLTPEGKILQIGYGPIGGDVKIILVQYLSNGALDLSFGNGGIAFIGVTGLQMAAIGHAFQPDGKLVLTGLLNDGIQWYMVMRLNPDGSFDTSFDGDGYMKFTAGIVSNVGWDVAIQNDGKIVMVGECELPGAEDYISVSRILPDGQLDTDFGNYGTLLIDYGGQSNHGKAVLLQPDGKILVGGQADNGGSKFFTIARVLSDGTLDPSFGNAGKSFCMFTLGNAYLNDMAMQADGKIILAGKVFNSVDDDMAMARYDVDGNLDPLFGSVGRVVTDFGSGNDQIYDVLLQEDQRILVCGSSKNGSESDFAAARYISGVDLNVGEISAETSTVLIYPNPIQQQFTLEFELSTPNDVAIELHSLKGERIAELYFQRSLMAGNHKLPLQLPNELSSGNYLIKLNTNTDSRSVKILITK